MNINEETEKQIEEKTRELYALCKENNVPMITACCVKWNKNEEENKQEVQIRVSTTTDETTEEGAPFPFVHASAALSSHQAAEERFEIFNHGLRLLMTDSPEVFEQQMHRMAEQLSELDHPSIEEAIEKAAFDEACKGCPECENKGTCH